MSSEAHFAQEAKGAREAHGRPRKLREAQRAPAKPKSPENVGRFRVPRTKENSWRSREVYGGPVFGVP